MALNSTVLVGRLTRDPELRSTQSGISMISFTLAVDDGYGKEKHASFIPCVAWKRQAEILSQYCFKGSQIGVSGHLRQRSYENNQGQKVNVVEVVATNIELLDPKNASGQQVSQNGQQRAQSYSQGNQPHDNYQAPQAANFGSQGQITEPAGQPDTIDVSSDDLPF